MPWTAKDAERFTKEADTPEKRRQWAAVANDALARCLDKGGERAECEASAVQQANGVVAKEQEAENMPDELTEVTKTVGGKSYPAGDFLVVEDPESPSTWHLQVKRNGEADHGLMGGAWAALHGGYRGNKYEGPGKAEALRKLKALYKAEDMETPSAEAEPLDLANLRELLAQALALVDAKLAEQEPEEDEGPAEIELAESASGHVLGLAEAAVPAADQIVPLHLDVAIIRPGWGNKRDNHYYPRDVVERDAGVFAGVKMYESDHGPHKDTRLWVSTVKGIKGYLDDGAPIAEVSVHSEDFAKRLIALSKDGLLEKMECSILASGTARKGEVEGRKAHIVEAITSAESVDWVTRAGAGGRALSLAEMDTGGEPMDDERVEPEPIAEQEPEPAGDAEEAPLEEVTLQEQQEPENEEPPAPATLDPERVQEMVAATRLPDAAKARLCEAEYAGEPELEAAIAAEVAYIKAITGSGKPFAQGASRAPEPKPRTAEEADADFKRILAEVGMGYLAGGN